MAMKRVPAFGHYLEAFLLVIVAYRALMGRKQLLAVLFLGPFDAQVVHCATFRGD